MNEKASLVGLKQLLEVPNIEKYIVFIDKNKIGVIMPYDSNKDLPKNVSDSLPEHAQDIFRKAFNNAYEEYGNEEQAFKVAWAAVEKNYKKDKDGKWVAK